MNSGSIISNILLAPQVMRMMGAKVVVDDLSMAWRIFPNIDPHCPTGAP